ncbi:glycerol-3-phosphate dehydrogenase/oxidase [Bacterioplanoides sp.]|uniref:glycerol-3-phosphate dehydrogenase/oxidase n=1 Tax=Bacterioplanoides sp. TaxID=2066072 RepID=UPI003AFFFC28
MAQQTWQADHRDRLFNRLNDANEHWDVIIAGGGITGAGIAREAARRGLKTLLLERQDFAWGTSSRSSKMVHGGLRYIAAGDVKTTMHSVQERERLMQEAPGLVDQMAYLMAHYKGGFPGPFVFNALLRIYDFFAGRRYRQFHTPDQLHFISPSINDDNLLGGTQYADAVTDDSRLVIRVLREAQKDGADVINYTSVKKLIKNGDQVTGAEIEDTLNGKTYSVSADVVINATGAWADELRSETTDEKKIRPARGSHLVVAGWRLPVSQSYTIMHPRDKRPVFIFPWEGRTVIGTTDLDHPQLGNKEAAITREEFDYLLEVAQFQFPQASLTESDIISSWAGVRPLVASGALNPSKEKRDHSIWDDQGLVSIAGGKLTTFRLIALDVLNVAKKYIRNFSEGEFSAQIFTPHTSTHQRLKALPDYVQKRLTGHFGMDVDALLTLARSGELEMIPGARAVWAELRWAAANEAVVHLDDLLLRRTRLGLLVEQGGLIYEDKIRAICADELGWTEQRWSEEKSRYQNIWNTCYSIPQ